MVVPVTSFVECYRKKLDYLINRGENEKVRMTLEWKPQGRTSRERSRKRWIDVVEDQKTLAIKDWRETFQVRDIGAEV